MNVDLSALALSTYLVGAVIAFFLCCIATSTDIGKQRTGVDNGLVVAVLLSVTLLWFVFLLSALLGWCLDAARKLE